MTGFILDALTGPFGAILAVLSAVATAWIVGRKSGEKSAKNKLDERRLEDIKLKEEKRRESETQDDPSLIDRLSDHR